MRKTKNEYFCSPPGLGRSTSSCCLGRATPRSVETETEARASEIAIRHALDVLCLDKLEHEPVSRIEPARVCRVVTSKRTSTFARACPLHPPCPKSASLTMRASTSFAARLLACLALAAFAGVALADDHGGQYGDHPTLSESKYSKGASQTVNDVHRDLARIHAAMTGSVHDEIKHVVDTASAVTGHVKTAVSDHVAKTITTAQNVKSAVTDHVVQSAAAAAAAAALAKQKQQDFIAGSINHVANTAETLREMQGTVRDMTGDHIAATVSKVADGAEMLRSAQSGFHEHVVDTATGAHAKFQDSMQTALSAMAGAANAWHEHVKATTGKVIDVKTQVATAVTDHVTDGVTRKVEQVRGVADALHGGKKSSWGSDDDMDMEMDMDSMDGNTRRRLLEHGDKRSKSFGNLVQVRGFPTHHVPPVAVAHTRPAKGLLPLTVYVIHVTRD